MTSSPRRFTRTVVLTACLAATALVGAQSASAATYGCPDVPRKDIPEGLYGGYFTNISAKGYPSKARACRSARSLVRAYYKCRRPKGVRATCHNKTVNGLKCRESNRRTGAVAIEATVTCTKGAKRIKHMYQQGLTKP